MCHANDYEHLQPTTPSKPTRIVVSGQPWPVPPYDWEMAATAGVEPKRQPSRLARLVRTLRMSW